MNKDINRKEIIKKRRIKEIERSLIKRYRKDIWARFIQSINEFNLIEDGDRIAVGISGGKDSLLLAKLLQEYSRHGPKKIEVEYMAMDPGYTKESREKLEELCNYLEIPVKVYDSDVFEVSEKLSKGGNPCYMCARMRRGFLYRKAEELNCNKLALGHHFNDVIETIMLNILCSGNFKTMMPKLKAENFENMELIRPLYYVKEKDIIRFANYAKLEPLDCACTVTKEEVGSKRKEIKELIESLEENFKDVDMSIFRSAQNVFLDGVIEWEYEGKRYSFLDNY